MGNKYDNSLTLLSKPTITQAPVPIFSICDSFFSSPWQKLPIIVRALLNVLASFKKLWLTGATNGRSLLFSVTSIHVMKRSVVKWTCNMILVKFASNFFPWHLCLCQYFCWRLLYHTLMCHFPNLKIAPKWGNVESIVFQFWKEVCIQGVIFQFWILRRWVCWLIWCGCIYCSVSYSSFQIDAILV